MPAGGARVQGRGGQSRGEGSRRDSSVPGPSGRCPGRSRGGCGESGLGVAPGRPGRGLRSAFSGGRGNRGRVWTSETAGPLKGARALDPRGCRGARSPRPRRDGPGAGEGGCARRPWVLDGSEDEAKIRDGPGVGSGDGSASGPQDGAPRGSSRGRGAASPEAESESAFASSETAGKVRTDLKWTCQVQAVSSLDCSNFAGVAEAKAPWEFNRESQETGLRC